MFKRLIATGIAAGLMAFAPLTPAEANSTQRAVPLKIEVVGDSVKVYWDVRGVESGYRSAFMFNAEGCPDPTYSYLRLTSTFRTVTTTPHIAVADFKASELGPNWDPFAAFVGFETKVVNFPKPADSRLNFTCGKPNTTNFTIIMGETPPVTPPVVTNYVSSWGSFTGALKADSTVTFGGLTLNAAGQSANATHRVQWMLDGVAAGTANSLPLTEAMEGKVLTARVDIYVGTSIKQTRTLNAGVVADSSSVIIPPVVTPPTPPVTKAKSTAKVTKVNYSKRSKKTAVTVKVTGNNGIATGKARITIKRGSKTVKTKVVTLNKRGAAKYTFGKIKKKGLYKVTVKYSGSSKYKASKTSAVKKFRIR